MTFEQFKVNVERWQDDRGIYAHSTALAQALKGVSEAGELADAVIKGDRDALKDSVGDVMVCLVGTAKMTGCDISSVEEALNWPPTDDDIQKAAAFAVSNVSEVCLAVALNYSEERIVGSIRDSVYWLSAIAVKSDLTLLECCESAWLEIKDRKGKMVAGGAFVKDVTDQEVSSARDLFMCSAVMHTLASSDISDLEGGFIELYLEDEHGNEGIIDVSITEYAAKTAALLDSFCLSK